MNSRERFLLGILIVIVGVLGYLMMQPFSTLRQRIEAAQKDIDAKADELKREEREIVKITQRDPRLSQWRVLSLPESKNRTPEEMARHISRIQVDYEKYLYDLLRRNEFAASSINITSRPPENKSSPVLGGKGPVYNRLTFTVQGQANFKGVVLMLNDFHRTSLLHQVRNLSILRPQTPRQGATRDDLDVALTVEALLITGADKRDALMPASTTPRPRVLAEPSRDYENMLVKNIYTGTVSAPGRLSEDKNDVLRFVKLTMLYSKGRRWEASLYDQAKGGDEKLLTTGSLRDFSISDKYGTDVLAGTVLDINQRSLYFRSEDRYYRLRLGDFLGESLEEPLDELPLLLGAAAVQPRK